ncbi:MAG: hypothetical protein M0R80_29725 [Proteobacteria bacterium]|jgi:hypothetical protein|nr:hypothetical protein [Pseudomonadota bacterium]
MSAVIHARELQVGTIISRVQGNPNIRGTVSEVHQFSNPVSALLPSRSPVGGWNGKGKEQRLAPLAEARVIAQQVEECYTDGNPTSVSVKIGPKYVTISADAQVEVWLPAKDAVDCFHGRGLTRVA